MVSPTFGTTGVDWENRLDFDRLRRERVGRIKTELEKSELGAVLTFDFHNIRYLTSTHIGTWAMDKMIRFALLPRGGDPVLWDFGSGRRRAAADRKSTRLNSSHSSISYAVFCLKKKTNEIRSPLRLIPT